MSDRLRQVTQVTSGYVSLRRRDGTWSSTIIKSLQQLKISKLMILLFHGDKNQKPSPSLSCKIVTRVTLLMAEPTSYVRSLLNLNTFSFYQVRFYLIQIWQQDNSDKKSSVLPPELLFFTFSSSIIQLSHSIDDQQ